VIPVADDPTRHLTPATHVAEIPENGYYDWTSVLDYFSPSCWLFEIVKDLTHVDVLEELLAPVSGHWEQVSAYGDALNKLSLCLAETGVNLHGATNALRPTWKGNAADAAFGYFDAASASLGGYAKVLSALQAEYQEVAKQMWTNCEAVKAIAEQILDDALFAAVAIAAGTVTAETGAGPLIGYGIAALKIANMLERIHEGTKVVRVGKALIDGLTSTSEVLSKQMHDIRQVPPIKAAYDHPAVR
jgi:uncharacterized protein YukE